MSASGPEESEIKIPVADLSPIRRRLEAANAERISERHDETNVLFDDARGSLAASGRALRLRRAPNRVSDKHP